jgi:uncharacterized protein
VSLARRVLLFPLVRAVIAVALLGILAGPPVLFLPALRESLVLLELTVAMAMLLSLWFVVRVIERQPFFATLLPARGAARDLGIGFGVGALLMCATMAVLALAGWYRVTGLAAPSAGAAAISLLRAIGLFFLVAAFEEMLFRGVVFRLIEDGLGTWVALAVSAAIFGIVHMSAPDATLWAAVAIALEAGVLLGAFFLMRRTLWMAIGAHWSWNLFEGPVFGANVSGTQEIGLLQSTTTGPALWTGGKFGPEAGLVCVILCTAAGITLVVIAVRRGRIMAPMWRRHSENGEP